MPYFKAVGAILFVLMTIIPYCHVNAQVIACEGEQFGTTTFTTSGNYPGIGNVTVYNHDTVTNSVKYGGPNLLTGCSLQGVTWTTSDFNTNYSSSSPDIKTEGGNKYIYYRYGQTAHTDATLSGTCYTDHYVKVQVTFENNPLVNEYVDTCTPAGTEGVLWARNATSYSGTSMFKAFVDEYANPTDHCKTRYYLHLSQFAWDHAPVEYDTACDQFTWRAKNYTATNSDYQDTVKNGGTTANIALQGNTVYCDMVYHLNLKIFDTKSRDTAVTVCDSFRWNRTNVLFTDSLLGRDYASGQNSTWLVYDSVRTPQGFVCHDTIWLSTLNVKKTTYSVDSVAACLSYTWINDSVYSFDTNTVIGTGAPGDPYYNFYGGTFTSTAPIIGDIRDTLVGANYIGCDSVVSLWLKVYPVDTLRDTVIACKNYTWMPSGKTYYSGSSFVHRDTVPFSQLYPTTGISTVKIYGDARHTVGNYTTGVFHCDSVYTLFLQLDSTYYISDYQTTCDSFQVAGRPWTNKGDSVFTFELDGAYIPISGQVDTAIRRGGIDTTWIHNDTLDHVNPLDNPGGRIGTWNHTVYFNLSTARFYCDSIVTLNLTLNKSRSDTTNTTENAAKLPPFYSEFDSICGDYPWHNANRLHNADTNIGHTPGTRQLHFSNVLRSNGCDSTLKVDLYVRPYRYDTTHYPSDWATSGSFCPGSQYITFGTPLLYHDSVHQDYHQEYNYLGQKFSDLNQCDSIFLKYYHVWDTNHTTQTEVVCDSFIWRYANLAPIDTFYASIVTNIHNPDRHGCDSVNTLFLTINYSNDSVLQLTTNPDTMVCEGYRWNRTGAKKYYIPDSITAPSWHDTASVKMPNANIYGCDSTLRLPMLLHQVYEIDSTWINCDTVKITKPNGQVKEYYTSVIDTFHWYSSAPVDRTRFGGTGTGCDSIVHNIIIVAHADTTHGTDTAVCDHLTWLDTTFTDPVNIPRRFTDYNGDSLKTRYGCDSAAYLNLSLKPNGVDSVTYRIKTCDQYEWNLNPGKIYRTIGDTIDSITTRGLAKNGCDTITVLHLRLCSTGYYDTTIHACDKYTWYGNTYYASTETSHKLDGIHATNGCDSVIRLHLTVDKTTTYTYDRIGMDCDSFAWNGKTFKADLAGYLDTITNAKGCDSIVTLNLTLKHGKFDTIDSVGCDSIRWYGELYHVSTYNIPQKPSHKAGLCANGCDSIQILSLKLSKSKLQYGEGAGVDTVIACNKYTWPKNDVEFDRNTTVPNPSTDPRPTKYSGLKTVDNCDSAVYLYLTLHYNSPDTADQDTVTACGEYTWYDTTVYQDWDGFEFITGRHTLLHNLTNTEGCDSTLRIHVIVNANKYADTIVEGRRLMPNGINYYPSVCDSFSWRGHTITSSGLHFDTVHLSTGCDSVYTINVNVSKSSDSNYNHFRCQGTYTWHDSIYSHSTDSAYYILPIKNHQGCDSVARLHLTISSDNYYIDSIEQCDNYTWHGHFFNTSITDSSISLKFSSSRGCDSTVHLYLLLHNSIIQTDTVNTCDSYFWNYNNRSYTTSKDTTYYLPDKTVDGCDSARRLLLTLHYSSHVSDTVIGCEEYKWLTPSGDAKVTRIDVNGHNDENWRDVLPNGNQYGCDSTTYLVLTIDTNSRGIDHQEFCNILTWNGYSITTDVMPNWVAGYYDTVPGVAANGCDSIYVLEAITRGSYMATDTVQACDRYLWKDGRTFFTSNTTATRTRPQAAANNCDSIYTLNLTLFYGTHNVERVNPCDTFLWHGITRRSEGRYTYTYVNEYACPSTDTLILTLRRSTTQTFDMGNQCNSFFWKDSTYYASANDRRVYRAANGCDSILKLSVIINHSDFDDTAYLSGCDSVLFEGIYYYRDTVIDRPTGMGLNAFGCPEMHRTYISVFPSYDSIVALDVCDSITWRDGYLYTGDTTGVVSHETTINGCDSSFTLNLTVRYGTYDVVLPEVTVCDIYRWHDSAYTTSTTARSIVGINAVGCDSADLQPIVIKRRSHKDTIVTACDQFVWAGRGRTYSASTIDSNRVGDNAVGCDSMVVLYLTVNYTGDSQLTRQVCDSLVWNDSTYRFTGYITQRYPNGSANGCDSTAHMLLTVNNSTVTIDEPNECDYYTWPVNGRTYSVSTNQRIIKGRDANGCDSAAVLRLTLKHKKTENIYQHACDSFPWHGVVYRTSGTYTHTDRRGYSAGCDSTTNLRLVLGHTSYHRDYISACDFYTWYGTRYTTSGNYNYHQATPNATNCDSISLLFLSLNYNDTILHDTTVCDSLTWFGTTYQWSQRGITNRYANNTTGCYTYDILNLRMGYRTTYDDRATTACDSFMWHGNVYRTTGRIVFDTITHLGCDSTIRMNLTIKPRYRTIDNIGDQCGSYTWHGTTYTESNNTATYHSPMVGPNGCDTIVTLNLAIREQGPYNDTVVVCNAYLYQGVTITHDTQLSIQGTSVYGCDSSIHRNVVVARSYEQTIDTTVCDSILWMGNAYTTSGRYQRVFPSNVPNCDSVLTLNFTVRGLSSRRSESLTACPGYRWFDQVLIESIDTTINLGQTIAGCDSTATIHFEATETARYSDTIHRACDRFVWNGQTFTTDTVVLAKFNMASGCDSLSLLHIYVRPTPTATDEINACDSITWRNGITYRGSTSTPTYRVDWGGFCDSVYTLHLTLNRSIALSSTKAAKDYYEWGDTVLLSSGVYNRTFTAANGCDSTVTLRLTITDVPLPVLVCNDNKLIMVNHYPYGLNFDRVDYVAYRWYRNGTLIPNANLDYYSEYGYTLLNGCYYVEVAIDAERTAWLPSEPFCIGTYGIDDIESASLEVSVMPNPVASGAAFTVRANSNTSAATLDIFDLQGRRLHSDTFSGTEQTYNIPLPAGIYTLRLTTANGEATTKKLIVR